MKNIIKNPFSLQKVVVVKICVVCTLFFIASGCGNSNSIDEELTSIIGKWRLAMVTILFVDEFNDYSKHDVVYEFKSDSVLTVSGNIDRIDRYRGHETGDHVFRLEKMVV